MSFWKIWLFHGDEEDIMNWIETYMNERVYHIKNFLELFINDHKITMWENIIADNIKEHIIQPLNYHKKTLYLAVEPNWNYIP